MPVKVRLSEPSDANEVDDTYIINVSSGGIFFDSRMDLQKGDKIDLQIMPLNLPCVEFGMIIKASATVVRAIKEESGTPVFLIAAQFDFTPRLEKLSHLF